MQVGEGSQSWEDAKRVVVEKHANPRGEKRIAQAMVPFRLAVVHNNMIIIMIIMCCMWRNIRVE